jgi:hypothetical protein
LIPADRVRQFLGIDLVDSAVEPTKSQISSRGDASRRHRTAPPGVSSEPTLLSMRRLYRKKLTRRMHQMLHGDRFRQVMKVAAEKPPAVARD